MLEIKNINGKYCPVLVCDLCGDRIYEASKAAIVHEMSSSAPDRELKSFHVHKAGVDSRDCHERAENLLQSGGGVACWEEMRVALVSLASNCGFPAKAMVQYDK